MANIELVIKIPDELYKQICEIAPKFEDCSLEWEAITNGTPLPKGHGDLIDSKALGDYFWEHRSKLFTYKDLQSAIDHAPTIIEADKESE